MFTKKTIFTQILLLVIAYSLPYSANANEKPNVIIEKASPLGFKETIEKLKSNAKALGWKVPKKWAKNFQKNLKHVTKVDIGRNLVIEMCEPWEAVKLLKHDKYKKFLSMMPFTVAIYEKSDGKVYISMMNMRILSQMFEGKEIEALVTKLAPQMDQMLQME